MTTNAWSGGKQKQNNSEISLRMKMLDVKLEMPPRRFEFVTAY